MRFESVILLVTAGFLARPAQAQPQLKVDVDQATFAYDADNSLIEIYMAFDASTLSFASAADGMVARLPVIYEMRRSTAAQLEGTPVEPVWADTSAIDFRVADTSAITEGQYFVYQSRAAVPPGEYEMEIVFPPRPDESRTEMSLTRDVVVPDYESTGGAALSEITLASSISRSSDNTGTFYKNGLDIRPNANQLYGGGINQLFYYAEAYNVDAASIGAEEYTMLAYIAEANRPQPIGEYDRRSRRQVRSPDVLVGSFDLSELPSGSYFLRLVVLNSTNEAVVERSRKFFVYNPDVQREAVVAEEISFEGSEFASMSPAELELELDRIDLIATDSERRRIRSIEDDDERRRFLYDFWQVRDPNPATRDNEFRVEFYQRVQFANERYTSSFTEGWESDRGRTVIKHGVPSHVEPHLYDRGFAPYEIWQYNNIPGEGRGIFIFADTQGFGEFLLLHSDVSGEHQNPQWQSELRMQ